MLKDFKVSLEVPENSRTIVILSALVKKGFRPISYVHAPTPKEAAVLWRSRSLEYSSGEEEVVFTVRVQEMQGSQLTLPYFVELSTERPETLETEELEYAPKGDIFT